MTKETIKLMKSHDAWKRGQNPWIVVSNPNTNEKHKPFVRVKANDLWGNSVIRFSMSKKAIDTNE